MALVLPHYSAHGSEYPVSSNKPCGHHLRLLSAGGVLEHVLRFGKEEAERASSSSSSSSGASSLSLSDQESLSDSPNFSPLPDFTLGTASDLTVESLTDALSLYNCFHIREFSTVQELDVLTASCDAFIAQNLTKMLNMSERSLISLPRVQVNVDVSEHTEDIWSSDVNILDKIVASVVRELSLQQQQQGSLPRQSQLYWEEKLVSVELQSDLSVLLSDSKKRRLGISPEKSTTNLVKQPSPVRRKDTSQTESYESVQSFSKPSGSQWEVLATHSVMGMGAMSVVKRASNLLLLNIQMVTKGGGGDLACPISPTTGIPLAMKDAFFSQMEKSRSGFGLVTLGNLLISIGGFNRTGVLRSVECFNRCANTWVPACSLSMPRARMAVAKHEDKVYAIGGSDGKSELNSMEVLDTKKDENGCSVIGIWSTHPSTLNTPRSDFGTVVLDRCIYVIGGTHYSTYLKSVEAFDVSEKSWKPVAPMATPRRGVAVVSCDGSIYAIGGQSSTWGCLKSVECYDPSKNKWKFVAPLPTPRRNACAITIGERVYVIGGYTGSEATNSVEIYDPATDKWTSGESMVLKRSSASAVLFQDAIYVVGGFSGTFFLNSVEAYDLDSELWTSYFTSS